MSGPRRLLLGTWNPAKQESLRRLVNGIPVLPLTPGEAGLEEPDLREDGWTFLDNAVHKARALARQAGVAAIASDGGLEIPALRGCWQGLRSRRFAGPGDDDRIAALLAMMKGIPFERREARFHEAVAIVQPDGRILTAAQRPGPSGRIAEQADPRRREGFWVPSVWLYPPRWVSEWDLTGAERQNVITAWDAVRDAVRPALESWAAGEC